MKAIFDPAVPGTAYTVDADAVVVAPRSARIISAAFSPIITDGAFVLPVVTVGMIDASATRSPSMPRTRSSGSTTAEPSIPILQVPAGWKQRIDASSAASDPDASGAVKFTVMGKGFHAVNPSAAVYWNPANRATGNYTLKGTFTLMKPSDHINYYGLVFGGSNLEGANQSYVYFLVAQDGKWIVWEDSEYGAGRRKLK